ncbi:hypothetical protein [Cupriavidus plantarum]|uniref:hypothetical protein n=1 Tax=Cupriavidus plantarum TaxID=942865 RepID=UPI00339D30A2
MTSLFQPLLVAAIVVAAAPAVAAEAAPVALRVQHELSVLGNDGVKRDVAFSENVYRGSDAVWIEREIPAAVQHKHHAGEQADKGHKHLDTATAARWIARQPDGKLLVRLVSDEKRRTFEVGQGDYGNVGFDGSWPAAMHLLDPALLKTMQPTGPVRNGVQFYSAQRGDDRLTVQWDVAGQYPRLVQSRSIDGTQSKTTRVSRVALPASAPWERARKYTQGEYSDLLD